MSSVTNNSLNTVCRIRAVLWGAIPSPKLGLKPYLGVEASIPADASIQVPILEPENGLVLAGSSQLGLNADLTGPLDVVSGGGLGWTVEKFKSVPSPIPSPGTSPSPGGSPSPSPSSSPTPTPSPTPCPPGDLPPYCYQGRNFWSLDELDSALEKQRYDQTCRKPIMPPQKRCYKHSQNQDRAKCYRQCSANYQSHHIVQNKAAKGLTYNGKIYSESSAPTVLLCGGSGHPGSQHDCANSYQRETTPRQFDLQEEIDLGYRALQEALACTDLRDPNQFKFDSNVIDLQMDLCVRDYFFSELGWPSNVMMNYVRRGDS